MSYLKPSYSPEPGVFVGNNGRVVIADGEGNQYELMQVQRLLIRVNNSVGGYPSVGSQTVKTYSGNIFVTGSLARAYMNLFETKMVTGLENVSSATADNFKKLLGLKTGKSGNGIFSLSRYPAQLVTVSAIINDQVINNTVTTLKKAFSFEAHWCLFDNSGISYNSNGLINSDVRFIASYPDYRLVDSDPSKTMSVVA